jgi:Zn-dependent protease with chaperone function
MTEDDFIQLVQKAEQDAEKNIKGYRGKLLLFAGLGYGVIFLILFSLVLLIGGTLGTAFVSTTLFLLLLKKKLIIVLAIVVWILLKAVWVKFEEPSGYVLEKKRFPKLFAAIDDLRQQLKSLPIHQVILTPELNAAVVQTPRLGIFGWHKNSLIVGLELLLILSAEEMRAVLAHELGHLSGNHSRFNGWIYRVRIMWQKVMDEFEHSQSFGAKLLQRFFYWYVPRFSAYSFALARNNEYEADAISVELTDKQTATRALVNVYASSPNIDEHYWSSYFKKADHMPEPDHAPYEGLVRFMKDNKIAQADMIARIKQAMEDATGYADTHPALKDRIDSIGGEPVLPEPARISAAREWFGDQYKRVLKEFDNDWYTNNKADWRDRYEYVKESQAKLETYASQDMSQLSDEDLWHYGLLNLEFKSDDDALPVFQYYKHQYPDNPDGSYMIGQILYRKDDEACLAEFEHAIQKDSLKVNACEYAYYYLLNHDREQEAEKWRVIAQQQMDINHASQLERSEATAKDVYEAPELNDEVKAISAQLLQHPKVKKLWVAKKVLRHYPESPLYLFAFTPKGFYLSYEGVQKSVAESLQYDGDVFVVVKGGDYRKLAKKVIKSGISVN